MTSMQQPLTVHPDDSMSPELRALGHLETTRNGLRIRIASLSPDQIYRGTSEDLSIAELIGLAVEREKAYVECLRRVQAGEHTELVEPEPTGLFIDRVFHDDLGAFFEWRRETLDILRSIGPAEWERTVTLRGTGTVTIRDLAVRLDKHDQAMLQTIGRHRQHWLLTTGVDELRDPGVAGKLSPNIAQ